MLEIEECDSGFWRRAAAFLFDVIMFNAIALAGTFVLTDRPYSLRFLAPKIANEHIDLATTFGEVFFLDAGANLPNQHIDLAAIYAALSLLVAGAYFSLMISQGGQTIGMAFVGTRARTTVVDVPQGGSVGSCWRGSLSLLCFYWP
jgi:hypothetical protein